MNQIISDFYKNKELFLNLTAEHLKITLISSLAAIVLGVLAGIAISEKKKIAGAVISVVNILYTIPSIALLGALISVTGDNAIMMTVQ